MKEYKVKVYDDDGTELWYLNGKLHKVIVSDGTIAEYDENGKITKKVFKVGTVEEYDGNGKVWKRVLSDGTIKEYDEKECMIKQVLPDGRIWESNENKRQDCDGKIVEIDGMKYKLVLEKGWIFCENRL